jgi:uncharacterized membrane protein
MKSLHLFWITLIMTLLCAGDALAQLAASSYIPSDRKTYCRRTFEWTFGNTGLWHSEIVGTITVPYLAEPLSGSLVCNMLPGDGYLSVWDSQGRNLMDGSHYASTDCSLTSFPEGLFPELIEDGMWHEFASVYGMDMNKGLVDCWIGGDSDDAWWIRIQDVTVQGRLYRNSIVIWNFDSRPFLSLDMHGQDVILGVTPPTPTNPHDPLGRAPASEFMIFAEGVGLIAFGHIATSSSGVEGERELVALAELVSISCHDKAPTYDAFDFPGTQITSAQGANDSGDIVGYYAFVPDDHTNGFVRDKQGNMKIIHFPNSVNTFARDINNRGDIAGSYIDEDNALHGFLLRKGVFTTIDKPGAVFTEACGINDAGDIAGHYLDSNGLHGFLFSKGSFETIDFPGAIVTSATGINNRGDIVGSYWGFSGVRGFVRKQSVFETIGFPGASITQATGINDAGAVVGFYWESDIQRGFLFEMGEYETFHAPCAKRTLLNDITTSGNPVGEFADRHEFVYGFSVTPAKGNGEALSD